MCGIAGYLGPNLSDKERGIVSNILVKQKFRGPDKTDSLELMHSIVGCNRLRIFGGPEADQPLLRSDLGICISLNGFISNHLSLRSQLLNHGYEFQTSSDTEVLLCGFHFWGQNVFSRLEGMYAFAIIDINNGCAFLGRDPFGIKPLYYRTLQDGLLFASFLPALATSTPDRLEVDKAGLQFLMSFYGGNPTSYTPFKNYYRVLAGEQLKIDCATGKIVSKARSTLAELAPSLSSISIADVKNSLLSSIRDNSFIEKPEFGLFLSGGIDSSILNPLIGQYRSVTNYCVGFSDYNGESGSEIHFAELVTDYTSQPLIHSKLVERDLLEKMEDFFSAMSEPMPSEDFFGFLELSKMARKNVQVVASGAGADEIFAGYPYSPAPPLPGIPSLYYGAMRRDRGHSEYMDAIQSPYSITDDLVYDYLEKLFASFDQSMSLLKRWILADLMTTFPADPLPRLDNATAFYGLEGRVPYCSLELVQNAISLPDELLAFGAGRKIVLRAIANELLPREIIKRPKMGFPVPEINHLSPLIRKQLIDYFKNQNRPSFEIFSETHIFDLIDGSKFNFTPVGTSKLWQLYVYSRWFDRYLD